MFMGDRGRANMHGANDTLGQIRLTQSVHGMWQCQGQSRDISVTGCGREQAAATLDSKAETEVEKESVSKDFLLWRKKCLKAIPACGWGFREDRDSCKDTCLFVYVVGQSQTKISPSLTQKQGKTSFWLQIAMRIFHGFSTAEVIFYKDYTLMWMGRQC